MNHLSVRAGRFAKNWQAGKRLQSALRWDLAGQYRQGFYAASAFFALVWIGLLSPLPWDERLAPDRLILAFVTLNLVITTFYYMSALVLFEKSEGALAGLAVSPLRDYEYLAAKVGSLNLLALAETLLITAAVWGLPDNWLLLAGGAGLLGCFYTLAGFIAIIRYDTLNEYLLPSVLLVTLLMLPLLGLLEPAPPLVFYLHPIQPMLTLLAAAFSPPAPWQVVYGLAGSLAWLGLAVYLARRGFDRFVVRAAGSA
jgi:fluoroquinolone transport system permease protein